VSHNKFTIKIDEFLEQKELENSSLKKDKKEEMQPIDEWIKTQNFKTTGELKVPELLLDQVIGQDKAVAIVRKAAEQKRHVMLIGDPGTGKSMVARAMTAFLPKEELEDIIAYPNTDDSNTPHMKLLKLKGPKQRKKRNSRIV
jgi:predicted ATP-dependent protease